MLLNFVPIHSISISELHQILQGAKLKAELRTENLALVTSYLKRLSNKLNEEPDMDEETRKLFVELLQVVSHLKNEHDDLFLFGW